MKKLITQQQAFVLLVVPEFQVRSLMVSGKGEETFCFFNYLAAACIKYLRPAWLKNNKHSQAFDAMVVALNQYRAKAKADQVYEQIGRDSGISGKAVMSRDSDHPLGICNLGLVLSKNPKDVRAVNKVFRTYFHASFTEELAEVEKRLNKERKKAANVLRKFAMKNSAPRSAVLAPQAVTAADDPVLQVLGPAGNNLLTGALSELGPRRVENGMVETAAEMNVMCKLLYVYGVLLLGEDLPASELMVFDRKSIPILGKSDMYLLADKLRDIDPSLETCLELSHKFQPFLCQAFLAKAADIDIAVLGEIEDPTCSLLKSMQGHGFEEFRKELVKERGLRMEAQKRVEALEGRVSALESGLAAAEAMKLKDGMTAIDRTELSELRASIKAANTDLEQNKEEVERLQRELRRAEQAKEKLETELSRLDNAYNDLNEQFIESFEGAGFFLEEDEEEDVRGSGLRGRLGDDAIRKLAARRMIVIGGHENTHATLKELFPDWEYYPPDKPVGKTAWAVDAIVCITCYMSHKSFASAKALAKAKGIRMIMIAYNSPISICQQLLTHLN